MVSWEEMKKNMTLLNIKAADVKVGDFICYNENILEVLSIDTNMKLAHYRDFKLSRDENFYYHDDTMVNVYRWNKVIEGDEIFIPVLHMSMGLMKDMADLELVEESE